MGIYGERILPHLVDRTCGVEGFRRWRVEAAEGLTGRVVELGFGSGLNMAAYPVEVTRIAAVEPSPLARELSAARVAASGIPVDHVGLEGESLPLEDDSVDGALCTFTLCTIPRPHRALEEVRRVLRPGGRFHVLEHGIAPDPGVRRWQRRIEPVQKMMAGGCHLTRDPIAMLTDAGFRIESSRQRYGKGPKAWTYLTVIHATSPS